MFTSLKKIYLRAASMCDTAYIIFRGSLILSCVLAFAALICMIIYNTCGDWWAKNLAADFIEMPAAILLVSIIGSAIIEDLNS